VWVRGGWFWMGSKDGNHPDSQPIHKVYVDGFWMGKYEVTNDEWAAFVKDTGYVTVAEKKPHISQLPPHVQKEVVQGLKKQQPFSIVFKAPEGPVNLNNHLLWWTLVEGADWKHPTGPKHSIDGKGNHPVVQVCYLDCEAFLEWKNKKHSYKEGWEYRLPTEAEWEFAARGGHNLKKFTWGDDLKPGDKWLANIWQGKFPHENLAEDGFEHIAPVGSYPANDYGLHDMAGNVWEWCHDFYMANYYPNSSERNPTGPAMGFDPREPGLPKRVQRGGSFLCDVSYCERYLTYARGKGDINSAADHTGFRIVLAPAIAEEE
jgi:formylglycine-generating enzyme required for sulfatase activity